MLQMESRRNPIIESDFPDPDVIRVGDTYYMASTTMHYMPGCDILRSYDLMNWEFVCHAYETLDDTPGHNLEGNAHIYGQGMWAPCLRYRDGVFYINFAANDTHKTYLLTARNPAGPWKKRTIEGFYYDSSLFFDDDGRVYIVHGQKELYLTELDAQVNGPKKGGLHRRIVRDTDEVNLGYEGSHLYKREGKYYLFTCHMKKSGNAWKTEDCFAADSLTGEFRGKCIIDDDMGYRGLGVAQGGMVDTPDGNWYLFMFQDRGALGRAPVLMPVEWDREGFPVIHSVPEFVSVPSTRPGYLYRPLNGDDDFDYTPDSNGTVKLKPFWQFNHNPVKELWSVTERKGAFRLKSGKICSSLCRGYNTLTQRTWGPESSAWVTVDGSHLKEGDYAGLSALIGCYGAAAVTRKNGQLYLVMLGKPAQNETVYGDSDFLDPAVEYERIPLSDPCVTIKACANFADKTDEVTFCYRAGEEWIPIGIHQKQYFKMDHFTGCRFALFLFSTEHTGGYADFMKFRYRKGK